ncbi:hypothetical protein GCM10009715_12050 [Paeniglutamicibacter psychrophenolicus]
MVAELPGSSPRVLSKSRANLYEIHQYRLARVTPPLEPGIDSGIRYRSSNTSASGLNFPVATIVPWNTGCLDCAITILGSRDGGDIAPDPLWFLSLLDRERTKPTATTPGQAPTGLNLANAGRCGDNPRLDV